MVRYEEFIKTFAEEFASSSIIEPIDFPEMDLYPDQVADFISKKLKVYGKEELLTRSMINDFIKQGLITRPESKKFNREQILMMELLLCLKIAYKKDDVQAMMKPFVENEKSNFDEKFDFYSIYEKLAPVFIQQRKESIDRTLGLVKVMKDAIRESEADDDDSLELFLVLLCIAMEVDTSMYIGKRLLREYFNDPEVPKPEKSEKPIKAKKIEKIEKKAAKKAEKESEKSEKKSEKLVEEIEE